MLGLCAWDVLRRIVGCAGVCTVIGSRSCNRQEQAAAVEACTVVGMCSMGFGCAGVVRMGCAQVQTSQLAVGCTSSAQFVDAAAAAAGLANMERQ